MSDNPVPLLAVLIDADNVPSKYADAIFQEIATLGEASVRRVYGDASKNLNGWDHDKVAVPLGLVSHHQRSNTTGKNASDIALVIDAMDLMNSGRFGGFVLVSSDSDFTRLAQRIREQGLDVYGMGEKKTPEAFRAACKRFIYVENLVQEGKAQPTREQKQKLNEAAQLLRNVYGKLDDNDGWIGMSQLGSQLGQVYPDFDSRSYGFRRLSDLVRETGAFEIDTSGTVMRVRLRAAG